MIDSDVLHKIRQVYRLTLDEMAALLNVSKSHLCRIEKSERTLTPTIRGHLISEFHLTPDKLAKILRLYDEFSISGRSGQTT